jgi:DNA-binding HxlR family transcriptional regulator
MEATWPSTRAVPRRRPATPDHELTCRARDMLDRIGDKWSLAVIHELAWGPKRFSELRRDVGGISQRMLTVTLRGLERDGILRRTVYPAVPPRVDYQLTELGESMLDTVCQLMAWTVTHLDEIQRARERYDARYAAGR